MQRRQALKLFAGLALCPLCASTVFASEGQHWSYEGATGPEKWGDLDAADAACSAGGQHPIDITAPVSARQRSKRPDTIVNNGHTIRLHFAEGDTFLMGDRKYALKQFHFHHPSEHLVEGKRFAMEAHFVNAGLWRKYPQSIRALRTAPGSSKIDCLPNDRAPGVFKLAPSGSECEPKMASLEWNKSDVATRTQRHVPAERERPISDLPRHTENATAAFGTLGLVGTIRATHLVLGQTHPETGVRRPTALQIVQSGKRSAARRRCGHQEP